MLITRFMNRVVITVNSQEWWCYIVAVVHYSVILPRNTDDDYLLMYPELIRQTTLLVNVNVLAAKVLIGYAVSWRQRRKLGHYGFKMKSVPLFLVYM